MNNAHKAYAHKAYAHKALAQKAQARVSTIILGACKKYGVNHVRAAIPTEDVLAIKVDVVDYLFRALVQFPPKYCRDTFKEYWKTLFRKVKEYVRLKVEEQLRQDGSKETS